MVVAMLLATAGIAVAQDATPAAPAPEAKFSTPDGYTSHHSIDMGGRMTNLSGSNAMYDTLVNLQSGPRVQGETFEMHALPGNKHSLADDLSAFGTGFGGDPIVMAKLSASKAKVYEFSGIFRRGRLYSNYDLLANPNIPGGQSIPIGPSNARTGSLAWPLVNNSPVMFNIVRRMTDTDLTLRPFDTFTYRFAYSHSTMEGPTSSPSYTPLGMKYNALLRQYERNGNDNFLGAIDWKPSAATKISLEMQANHYKSDTFFTLDPSGFLVQEADGTPAYLGNFTSLTPYGIAGCNTGSMGTAYTNSTTYTLLSPANKPGGLPIINPACDVVTSYMRSQPTRIWTPTGTLRFQSSAIKNVSMNGNAHYTEGTMSMPNYYESSQGLGVVPTTVPTTPSTGSVIRSATSTGGYGDAHRAVIGADYGLTWLVSPVFSLSDQASYSSIQEPSYTFIPVPVTLSTTAAPNQTINYSGPLTPGVGSLPHGNTGKLQPNFFGQEYVINNATASWDVSSRARFAFTYRFSNRNIGQGIPHRGPIPIVVSDPVSGNIAITENAGVFNAALRLAKQWSLNGTVEAGYADNAFTAVGERQFRTYRVHTLYKPKTWATISGSYSDRERHNNTNNNQDVVAAGDANYSGPINHVDYFRMGSGGLALTPNEHFGVNLNYTYSDVYAGTNVCYTSAAAAATATTPAIAGAATVTSSGAPNLCVGNATWFARDFMNAPTQFGMVSLSYNPNDKIHSNVGYTASDVNGSRFFNDARDVNGSMVSLYQSPFVNVAYTMHPGLIWKAQFNYYGYGEGGPSGAAMCSTATSLTATITPCGSIGVPTGLTEGTAGATAPRVFHANNVTLGVHYEF
ncbi:MAG: hypothetical protein WBQ94_12860 [Terracidiphilus sp.]